MNYTDELPRPSRKTPEEIHEWKENSRKSIKRIRISRLQRFVEIEREIVKLKAEKMLMLDELDLEAEMDLEDDNV